MNDPNSLAGAKATHTIIFGGGCFWCVEAIFQMLKGVAGVTSGYAGGVKENPTYEEVCSGTTGHAEVIKVEFDPSVIELDSLLAVFFTSHDPTTKNRQGNDIGTQYRSAIYYSDDAQKIAIEAFIKKLSDEHTFKSEITTEVLPAKKFYPAEQYHQNYYLSNPGQTYCQVMIDPKINKLREKYTHLLK